MFFYVFSVTAACGFRCTLPWRFFSRPDCYLDILPTYLICARFFGDPYLTFLLFGRSSLKTEKCWKSAKNFMLASWKLGSGLPCFQKNFEKPIECSESWVNSLRKIYHQISSVTSSSWNDFSLKLEFFFQKVLRNIWISQTFKIDSLLFISYMVRILLGCKISWLSEHSFGMRSTSYRFICKASGFYHL